MSMQSVNCPSRRFGIHLAFMSLGVGVHGNCDKRKVSSISVDAVGYARHR